MSYYLPKYIMKKMFPREKSMFLIRKDNSPTPNFIMFRSVNIIIPVELPFPGMEQFSLNSVADYAKISTDGKPLEITGERFANDVQFWCNGKCIDANYFERVKKGTAESLLIPMGVTTTLLLRIRDDIKHLTSPGSHTIDLDLKFQEYMFSANITLELLPENMDVVFNPLEI